MVVDAWVALQALRAAAAPPPDKAPDEADVHRLYKKDVDRIALEHLLVGSAITGSPAYSGGGLAGDPGNGNGGTGPTSTDSYLFSGGDTRTPVAVLLDAPTRMSGRRLRGQVWPPSGSRRPGYGRSGPSVAECGGEAWGRV